MVYYFQWRHFHLCSKATQTKHWVLEIWKSQSWSTCTTAIGRRRIFQFSQVYSSTIGWWVGNFTPFNWGLSKIPRRITFFTNQWKKSIPQRIHPRSDPPFLTGLSLLTQRNEPPSKSGANGLINGLDSLRYIYIYCPRNQSTSHRLPPKTTSYVLDVYDKSL